jgi:hypothetical protein
MLVARLSLVFFVFFVGDATAPPGGGAIGKSRRWLTGASSSSYWSDLVQSMLIFWGKVLMPLSVSSIYLGPVMAMGYELSGVVLRSSQLVHELEASEAG